MELSVRSAQFRRDPVRHGGPENLVENLQLLPLCNMAIQHQVRKLFMTDPMWKHGIIAGNHKRRANRF
jgi:hypothetical protein